MKTDKTAETMSKEEIIRLLKERPDVAELLSWIITQPEDTDLLAKVAVDILEGGKER